MTCAATSGGCGVSTACAPSAPAIASTPGVISSASTPIWAPSSPSRHLTAEEKEELQKKREERAEKKRQQKEVRDEAKADTKAKLPDTTSKKAKLRLYITLLKLRFHL